MLATRSCSPAARGALPADNKGDNHITVEIDSWKTFISLPEFVLAGFQSSDCVNPDFGGSWTQTQGLRPLSDLLGIFAVSWKKI